MNELIQKLAEQAGGEFYEGFAGSTNFIKFAEDDLKKFVDSIVRECVLETMDAIHHNTSIRIQVYEHFGVAE